MLSWFRRKPVDPVTETDSVADARPESHASSPAHDVSGTGAEGARRPQAGSSSLPSITVSALWDVITGRVRDLLAGLPEPMRRSDAPAVLQAIGESLDTAIGQPPFAAQRALAVSRNPHSSVDDLAKLFASDPGLAQALLSHANSSFYLGRGEPCTSLSAAVQRIGSTGVESVLLSNTVQGVLCRPGGRYDGLVDQVWFHMVRTGPIARQIAPAFGVEPERAFSMALLHDAGKLVLFEQVSHYRKNQRREVTFPHHLLLQALKRLHEPIGGLAALRWGLEEQATRAITTHHRNPVPAYPDSLSEVLFLAEKLDLAHVNATAVNLDELWSLGGLSGDPAQVRAIMGDEERLAA